MLVIASIDMIAKDLGIRRKGWMDNEEGERGEERREERGSGANREGGKGRRLFERTSPSRYTFYPKSPHTRPNSPRAGCTYAISVGLLAEAGPRISKRKQRLTTYSGLLERN